MKMSFYFRIINVLGAWMLFAFFNFAGAGFLEMPDTSEVPEYERESLLLDLDIPALRDRDPNPEAGPRLNVKEFRVQGLVEYPEFGITRQEIIKQVEKIRFDMMDEGELLESGYTIEEIKQVSDLVAQIEKETEGRHVDPVDVQKLVFLIREQRRQRGITLGMIETVADTITRYYRERGFILAKAYIPKQHVRDGVVTITLLLGQLGEVETNNNKMYSDRIVKRIFKSTLGKPVSNNVIEEKLYLVNDLPGVSASGYFEPGSQVGDTKLNINFNRERRLASNLRLDNHGSEATGEYRAYADFHWNNPLTIGDQLQLGVLGSFKPENSIYGSARYSLPVYTPRTQFSLGVSSNDFVTDDSTNLTSDFEISGKSLVADANLTYKISRSRINNQHVSLGYSQINSQIEFGNLSNAGIDKTVNKLDLGYSFDMLNEKDRVLHQGGIVLTYSEFIEGADEGQDLKATIISLDYSRLSFLRIPFTKKESKLILRAVGQYSGASLSEVLQFGLAGPTRARGYKINEFYADDAVYIGADWVFDGPQFGGRAIAGERWEKVLQPFIFLDASYGVNNAILEGEASTKTHLVDAGVGIKLAFKDGFKGNLSFAFPVDAKNSALESLDEDTEVASLDRTPGDGMKLYFDFQYSF
jgi:hemolysin activation/secretion protein